MERGSIKSSKPIVELAAVINIPSMVVQEGLKKLRKRLSIVPGWFMARARAGRRKDMKRLDDSIRS